MQLRSLTNGKASGTGTVTLSRGKVIGAVIITADGTNAAAVILRKTNASGEIVFDVSTKTPLVCDRPIEAESTVYYSISGTGASAMLYEHVP